MTTSSDLSITFSVKRNRSNRIFKTRFHGFCCLGGGIFLSNFFSAASLNRRTDSMACSFARSRPLFIRSRFSSPGFFGNSFFRKKSNCSIIVEIYERITERNKLYSHLKYCLHPPNNLLHHLLI